jgi:outer membrane protein
MKRTLFILLLVIFGASCVIAQKITIGDAVSLVLKNNYDILISRTAADIDKTNNTPGNAGMLPELNATGSDVYSVTNISQDLSNGTTYSAPHANSNSFNAGIALDWTLFDGGKMFVSKKTLNEIEALGEIQYKDKVLQTVYEVIVAYFNVVKQKQQLASYNEVINFNEERVKILQASFNAGLSPKTDLLLAQIDLNVNLELAISQQTFIVSVKRVLNQMMGREADSPFEVEDSIPLNYVPDKAELNKKLYTSNTQILSSQKEEDIAKLNVKLMRSLRFPEINFTAGYNFLNSTSPSGSITSNYSYGPQIGGFIRIPLYEGGNINRQINVAKLQLKSSSYSLQNIKLDVNTQLQNALTTFEDLQKMLAIERNNALLVRENLNISMNRLRLGQTTSLEVHQAQESFEESHTRLINFEYLTKVAEAKLKQLMGTL